MSILIYNILYNLYSNNITSFSIVDLYEIYKNLKSLNESYNNEYLNILLKNERRFIKQILATFSIFGFGTYIKGIFEFNEPIILTDIINNYPEMRRIANEACNYIYPVLKK